MVLDRPAPVNERRPQDENAAEYTTRLLSGSAYRRGILGAFELLSSLRSDRYKAKSPESRLDLDRIALHAIQSVSISIMFATAAIAIWLVQLFSLGLLSGEMSAFAILLNFIGAVITAYELFYLRWAIARKFLKQSYNPNFQLNLPLLPEFLQPLVKFFKRHIIEPEPAQNVIISGRYVPFLGAGGQISRWTLAIDRKPTKDRSQETTRIDIPVEEFYRVTDREVAVLNLPNLEQLSRLFVEGFELKVDGKILTSPKAPVVNVMPEDLIWVLGQGSLSEERRTYRLYRYIDNERDQVLSYFLRFYNVGSITFVESSTHILPSIDRRRFSLTPVLQDSKASRFIKMLFIALLLFSIPGAYALVGVVYLSIFAWKIISWRLENAKQLRAANWHEEYNYGHIQTFRESISTRNYESYYGVQDLTMYWKSIEQAVLSGTIALLKQYGVDTSQFEEIASNIINTGIMVSGGNFSAAQVAAGMGATAVTNNNSQQQTNPMQQVKTVASNLSSIPKSN